MRFKPRHTRPVQWLQTDIPRTTFEQDLLYSFGAFMTVCKISRNDAESRRVAAVLEGKADPGPSVPTGGTKSGWEGTSPGLRTPRNEAPRR